MRRFLPNVKIPANSKLLSWVPAGMVSIGHGGNEWAGGANTCAFDASYHLPGSTVKIDGKAIVENGTLKQ